VIEVVGKVIDGKVVVEGHVLQEGMTVRVLIPEDAEDEPFHLTPEMEAELDRSIAQADRGELIPAARVLEELRVRAGAYGAGATQSLSVRLPGIPVGRRRRRSEPPRR
jgi:hypothetical protein